MWGEEGEQVVEGVKGVEWGESLCVEERGGCVKGEGW